MTAAVLATEEEWSIISSSDFEEPSGNTSDFSNDADETSSEAEKKSDKPSVKINGKIDALGAVSGDTYQVATDMESTIVPETTEGGKTGLPQPPPNFQSIRPHLVKTRAGICGTAKELVVNIVSRYDKCEKTLRSKSRALFAHVFGVHLANMKMRAKSAKPLSFVESISLESLLWLEKYLEYIFSLLLLYFLTVLIISGIVVNLNGRNVSLAVSPPTLFLQQYDDLKRHFWRRPAVIVSPKSSRYEIPRVKDLYFRAISTFHPKSASVAKLNSGQSSLLARFWSQAPKQEPHSYAYKLRLLEAWNAIRKSTQQLRTITALLNLWEAHPQLNQLKDTVNTKLQSYGTTIQSVARANWKKVPVCDNVLKYLQKQLKSDEVVALYLCWKKHVRETVRAKYQELYPPLSRFATKCNVESYTMHLRQGKQHFEMTARHSFNTVQRFLANLRRDA